MVGGSFNRHGSGRVALLEVREGLGDSPGGLEVVRTQSRRSETGRETLPVVR